jgi:2-hydroxycyclohexanecarboxyl-CoA dehydrogenase
MGETLDLAGRVALVTGAGQGVGRQIALDLAAHNAGGVAVNDFYLERAEEVAGEIRAAGGKAIALQADVTDFAGVKAMVAAAEGELGPIGVLVNNAGNAGVNPNPDARKPFWETGPEVWNSFIGVNFYGDTGLEVYAGAKAGAAGFMRGAARALGRFGITANSVSIATTVTPATEGRMNADPELVKKMMGNYVIRRPGQPSDIASMVLFLASDASSWITGQTYGVNGGFTFGL